jgi:subtilisin family serine protease
MPIRRLAPLAAIAALAVSCTHAGPPPAAAPAPVAQAQPQPRPPAEQPAAPPAQATPPERPHPVAPPEVAYRLGLMPLASAGVLEFRAVHPTFDGRGVLLAILDSGVDPGVLGLQATTTGAPKLLDLRNFSGEGDVVLAPVTADAEGRIALPGGLSVAGAATVRAAAAGAELFGGVLEELPFGDAPAADFNGNGTNRDRYAVVVVRGASGWLAFVDTNADGTLADETAVADYLVRRETFTFRSRFAARGKGPITAAVNLADDAAHPGRPRLSFFLDTAGHGTHVAGIATGHDLYGVQGFDGVAPGAQVIALKIADNARGGISTTGSMIRAMEYAARFAAEHQWPLVMNMSFGIGNEIEGGASMDSLVDAFLRRHPDVVFAISAGNDGPGTSTMGLPGSAQLALTVGAVYPAAFARLQFGEGRDVLGYWGSRGGELAKPDIVTPGIAYSSVPAWNTGGEIKLGTSMAAPYATGLVALLESASVQERRPASAAQLIQALRVSARPFAGETRVDQGYGEPRIEAAYRWLAEGHAVRRIEVRAMRPVSPLPPGLMRSPVAATGRAPAETAAYRRGGLEAPADTVQLFRIAALPDGSPQGGATYRLVSTDAWVRPTAPAITLDATGSALIEMHYTASALARPGRHVGTVVGYPAADSAAGPAFVLVNTVVVPETGAALAAPSRVVGASAADRYYLRVPEGASGFAVRAAVRDSTVPASVHVFEPSGRPSRGTEQLGLGAEGTARASAALSANDVVPGVWEVVVQAPPTKLVGYDLDVAVPDLRIAALDSAGPSPRVTFAAASGRDTTVTVVAEQLGATRLRDVTIVDGALVRDTVEAPVWARKAIVEVWVPRDAWDAVTDFSITLYDRDGAQIGQGAMNYDFHRVKATLPEHRTAPFPVQVELFPAFAHDTAPAQYPVRMRVTFTGDARRLQVMAGQGAPAESLAVRIPARGTAAVAVTGAAPMSNLPGWDAWVRVWAGGRASDWMDVERFFPVRLAP